jgi:hypothetical protein
MKLEQTECSEASAYKIHTLGNYPEESIQQEKYCFCHRTAFRMAVEYFLMSSTSLNLPSSKAVFTAGYTQSQLMLGELKKEGG